MDRGVAVAVGLAVLVALSGCASFFGGGSADGTPTPDPGPGDGEGDPFADVTFPDGTSVDGIDDRAALLAGHRTAINESSYEVSYSVDIRQGGTAVASRTVGTRSNLSERRSYSLVSEPGRVAEAYRNETTFVTREFRGNDSQYTVQELDRSYPAEHARIAGTETIDLVVRNANFTAEAVLEHRDGSTYIQYALEEARVNASANVSFATGSIVVDQSGVVHSASLRVEGTNQGARYLVDMQYRLVGLGNVPVDRPDWVDEAVQA